VLFSAAALADEAKSAQPADAAPQVDDTE